MNPVEIAQLAFRLWREIIGPLLETFGVKPGSELEERAYALIDPIFAEATEKLAQFGATGLVYPVIIPYVARASAKLRELGLSEVSQ